MRQEAVRACDVEPIHTPGRVQAHGALFVLDSRGHIAQVSDNCADFTGRTPSELLGQHVGAVFMATPEAGAASESAFGLRPQIKEVVVEWGQLTCRQMPGLLLVGLSHCNSQDTWILECERLEGEGLRYETHERRFQRQIRFAQQNLYDAPGLQQLIERAVQHVFDCLGFDHVMAYRFDTQWNGTVLAEARAEGIGSYMGQKFPASDIPSQARLTFLRNWLRCIPDVTYRPSPIVDGAPAGLVGADAVTLDMMLCHLRAPSPVHIQYLRNMGVRATMTMSLVSGGKLWGLIACHHAKPARLPYEQRQAAEMISRTASALLASKEADDNSDYRQQIDVIQTKLFKSMGEHVDLVPGLIKSSPNMLDLVKDSISSAAVFFEGRWSFLGPVPPVPELNGFVKWLARSKADVDVWHTETIVAEYPASEDFCRVASGVLAMNVPKSDNTYVLWFRPEVRRVVEWAGAPEKSIYVDDEGAHLHPRTSFEIWREVVRCRSMPWQPVEIEAASVLRKNIIELDLKRQFRREQKARADVEAEKQRFRFLSDATALLGQSLDYEATLLQFSKNLARVFCDWVCIYVDGEQGLQRTFIAHATPEGQKVADELHQHAPIYSQLLPRVTDTFEARVPLFVARGDIWLQKSVPSAYTQFLTHRLGFESMLLLPIVARDKILGVIKCVRSDRARKFSKDDFQLGLQLSERAASCVDNALLYRKSQQAILARDHVMGVVSHDLRNPLGAIRLTADMITRKYTKPDMGQMPVVVARGLEKIQSACRRMNDLIEDILSMSKIEAGHFTVDTAFVLVTAVLDEAINLLEPLAEAKQVTLKAATSLHGVSVSCDMERILQVLSNLIGNAIKFTPASGTIILSAVRQEDCILFSVADTGAGIVSEHLPHVFDRFWQAARTARHGAGLGLAIAKGIVEAHGGTIFVDSVEGKGTCFSFCLKAA